MKKFLAYLLVAVLVLSCMTGCKKDDGNKKVEETPVVVEDNKADETKTDVVEPTAEPTVEPVKEEEPQADVDVEDADDAEEEDEEDYLESAKTMLFSMYKDKQGTTASDYERVSVVRVGDVAFNVTWSVDNADAATIIPGETTTQIDINEETKVALNYVLTATIADAEGNTVTQDFTHDIPAYKEASWDDFVAAKTGDVVVLTGVVTGIMSKTNGNTNNCLYFQDDNGAYYAYGLSTDPVTDGIKLGMTVKVTGKKDIYSGTLEIANCSATIVDKTIKSVKPVDYTSKYLACVDNLKDTKLTEMQAKLVTLKGVEITTAGENGYYNFQLGGAESYIRISSSVCPIVKEKDKFIAEFEAHKGWIANATGVICVYDGKFYLTPISVDAFEYVSLPKKSDAEMVEFEAAPFLAETSYIPAKVADNKEIDAYTVGQTYDAVSLAWTSDNECAVIDNGKLTITLPEVDTEVKITVVITCGKESKTIEQIVKVDAAPTDVYVAKVVKEFEADKAYKFGFYQALRGETLYFAGEMDGNYLATTNKADKAVDVFAEAVEGGYKLYFMNGETKNYIDIYEYAEGKAGVRITTEPTAVFKYNKDVKVFYANVAGNDMYLGTYKTYNTISASKTSYILDDTSVIGATQFPAQFVTTAPAQYVLEVAKEVAADKAYKFAFYQALRGETLYFTGNMSGNYLETTNKADKAVDVFAEVVEGGYKLYFKNGDTKNYIDIYEYAEGKAGVRITTEPTAVFQYNKDVNVFYANVAGADMYLGTYKTYNTISASKTSYILDDTSVIGATQFPAQLCNLLVKEVKMKVAKTPAEATAYKFAFYQALRGENLYFAGDMNGNYLATTNKLSKAVDVFAEAVDGGFKLYFMNGEVKTYIDIYEYAEGKAGVRLTTEPTAVFKYNKDVKVLYANVAGADMYLGTYKTYNTISASKTSYILDDTSVIGATQFPAQLVTIEVVK